MVSQEAFDRVVAAGEGELPDQRLVDRRPGNALSGPGQDLVCKGENLGLSAFCWGRLSGQLLDDLVGWKRRILVQPALILSQQTELACLDSAHKAGLGNLAIGLAQAHPTDYVTNFMEPGRTETVDVIAHIGPGDQGEPVLTLMLPEDD